MKELSPHDRPREKLERAGADTLGDNELVAVLLGHGTAGLSALEVATRLLAAAGGLHGLTRMRRTGAARVAGVGPAQAARVAAAVELGRRTLVRPPPARPRLRTPREVAEYLLPLYGAYPVERFGIVLLDTRHRLIRTRLLSVGSLDASLAHPREVFREAVTGGAACIVAFHNHPSGDPTPSPDDLTLTARLVSAGEVVGVDVVDHLILADSQYCSLRESGRL